MTRVLAVSRALAVPCALAAIGFALAACAGARKSGSPAPAAAGSRAEPSVLYARDGRAVAVDGTPRAMPVANEAPLHGLEPRGESRMQLLDLYQRVVGDKEGLAAEVRALEDALEKERAERTEIERERGDLRARVATLEQSLEGAQAERDELVARLTTAQIRRLEAEKLLLENEISSRRTAERPDPRKKPAPAEASTTARPSRGTP